MIMCVLHARHKSVHSFQKTMFHLDKNEQRNSLQFPLSHKNLKSILHGMEINSLTMMELRCSSRLANA